jgi:hypothetical protein
MAPTGFKSWIVKNNHPKNDNCEFELYIAVAEFGNVNIHGYPILLSESEIEIKFDSYHLTLDTLENCNMKQAVEYMHNLFDNIVEVSDYDKFTKIEEIQALF